MSRAVFVGRLAAVLIAILAVIDPAVRLSRTVPAVVALLADSSESALLPSVEKRLSGRFLVVHGPLPSADVSVVVGRSLPRSISESGGPVIGLESTAPVWIDSVEVPQTPSVNSTVNVHVRVGAPRGALVDAALTVRGLTIARATQRADAKGLASPSLGFVPVSSGPTPLMVEVRSGSSSASASDIVDVRDNRWLVFFYDARPSWMSTFVKRSVEADPRFVVAERVHTSRGVATATTAAPSTLSDPSVLESYDAIIVGAPDQLRPADVDGLHAFLRQRAGSVVLLFDETPSSASAVADLLESVRWSPESRQAAVSVRAGTDSVALKAGELASPVNLPPNAEAIAFAGPKALVWRVPSGPGMLIVSGALDAWRYRSPSTSGFDNFWRATTADAAKRALPPLDAAVSPAVSRPSESRRLDIAIRDAALGDPGHAVSASVSATLDDSVPIRVWPVERGRFEATLPGGVPKGTHRVAVSESGHQVVAVFAVDTLARHALPDQTEDIRTRAVATGGATTTIDTLAATVATLARQRSRLTITYPMRSPWWILPFAALLALEWWWRRRNGNS